MTKTASFAAIAVIAGGTMFGAPRPETSTYVDGNVDTLKPNTGGTLVFRDNDSIMFRTGLADVTLPYAGIQKAELGATKVHSHGEPAYKVWALPQRLHKTETQLLTVEFKNKEGENRTMVFELAKPAASAVLATIQEHTGSAANLAKGVTNNASWWGDGYWKTKQNQSTWENSASASSSAPAGSK